MSPGDQRPVGLTKDAGWQIGVRRTLPCSCREAWRLLTSSRGLRVWLGALPCLDASASAAYELEDGTRGELKVFVPDSHLRITWQPEGWPRPSTIQVRVIAQGDRCVIAFHQEHLPGSAEREQRRAHYAAALDELGQLLHPAQEA